MKAAQIGGNRVDTRRDGELTRLQYRAVVHREVLLARVTDYGSEGSVWFDDLRRALRLAGFCERARGSHFVYSRRADRHIVTLQARDGRAQPYQVRQVRGLIK